MSQFPCNIECKTVSLAELITKHTGYLEQLTHAIGVDDIHEIEKLDYKVTVTFEKILKFSAYDEQEAKLQATFLLDQLSPKSTRSVLANQICDQLLTLLNTKSFANTI